jgi:hypothetical protein
MRTDDVEHPNHLARLRARLTGGRATVALCAAWTVMVAALTAPSALGGVGSWLDSSWQVGLSLSQRLNLPMGSRLFFPYGPYGYLTVTTPFFLKQWLEAVAAGAVIHVTLIALVCLLLARWRAGPAVWVAVTIAVVIGLPSFSGPDTEGQLVAILLAFFAVELVEQRVSVAAAALCGAMLALLLLMKATAVPLVAGVLVISLAALIFRRRLRAGITLVGAFAVCAAVLWFAAGLGIGDVSHYLHAALEFGSGYSGAMYFGGLTPGIVLGGAVIVVLGLLGIGLLVRRRRGEGLWMLLAATALFPLFKDSFVRDGPVRDAIYYGVVAVLAGLSLAVVAPMLRSWLSRRQALAAGLLLACFLLGACWRATDLSGVTGAGERLASYGNVFRALLQSDTRHSLQAAPLQSAQAYYAATISALPPFPPGATVDVMPWDVGLIYEESRLQWDPRPVLQSYQAYTPWLDQFDADFLRGVTAPDYIIYSYLTVDDRYAAFDEPATFRALLESYRVVATIGSSVAILQRVPRAPPPAESPDGTTCAALGTAITIPQHQGARTYAHVDLSRSLLGRVLDTLAKAPEARITLSTAAGSSDHRLVAAVATDGLYVSDLLTSTPDIATAIAGSGGVPMTSLTVSGDPAGWSSRYCVTFTTTSLGGETP